MNFKLKPAFAIPVVVGRYFSFYKSINQLILCLFCITLLIGSNLFLAYSNYQSKRQSLEKSLQILELRFQSLNQRLDTVGSELKSSRKTLRLIQQSKQQPK